VAFFSESACKFYLEDLYRFFIAPRKDREDNGDEDEDVAAAIAAALSYDDAARFDLILGWDLFNYMERSAIELLMARIARSCRSGTLLFLTVSTGAMISSTPARITMTSGGRLHDRTTIDDRSIANSCLSPTALESMMPGFRLLHSFLLGDEMQEFLFSYA
jgi:O-methyltransferase involved in polyketide biosynthesis